MIWKEKQVSAPKNITEPLILHRGVWIHQEHSSLFWVVFYSTPVTQVLGFLQDDFTSAGQAPGSGAGGLGKWWYPCHLPSLSWACWRWPHVRLVYFDVLLGRERSVANWKKTITFSIPFSPLCQSRKVVEIWLPQLFGKRLVKTGGKTSTTNIDVVSALNSFDIADRIMMLLWYQYLTNGECYSPFQWLVWEEGPQNVLLYAGFAKVVFFSSPGRSQRNWLSTWRSVPSEGWSNPFISVTGLLLTHSLPEFMFWAWNYVIVHGSFQAVWMMKSAPYW